VTARQARAEWLRTRRAELESLFAGVIEYVRSDDERWLGGPWGRPRNTGSPPDGVFLSALTASLQGSIDAYTLAEVASDERVDAVDIIDEYLTESTTGLVRGDVMPTDWSRHELGSLGRGVIVAVIDAGVDAGHPAFGARATQFGDYTDDGHVYPDPHGTFVAGLIGADSAVGRGVTPECDLHLYKVQSLVRTRRILGSQVEKALSDASENGADIINCSFGVTLPQGGLLLEKAIATLIEIGITVVKSAGNDGPEPFSRPCETPGLIVAGAWDTDADSIAAYSSRGAVGTRMMADIHAPGGTDGNPLRGIGSTFGAASSGIGTSFAAALVTGAASALCGNGVRPLSPATVLTRLVESARVVDGGLRVLF
jgi:serine protease AprX